MKPVQIKYFHSISKEESQKLLKDVPRQPILFKQFDIGSCIGKWTREYLGKEVGSRNVKVHVCSSSRMDFLNKNFCYKTLPFSELIKRASETHHGEGDYFLDNSEKYYLRSLGEDVRRDVANIRLQFPTLSQDIVFPDWIPEDKIFSSVFRVGSAGITLWTHYDVMDNILIQVVGRKKAVLFPPDDVSNLYMNGDKSEVLDIDNPDLEKFPEFSKCTRYECLMEPGDILLIPALWFHNMTSVDFGVAVNVFWKHLDDVFYDSKDPYGNKDYLPASQALALADKIVKCLDQLPDSVYKRFYAERVISKIVKSVNLRGSDVE